MATYSTNEFKSGLKIMLDGDPYTIVENEFVKPGKGQAFNRVRVRNLKTGRVIETNRSNDSGNLHKLTVFGTPRELLVIHMVRGGQFRLPDHGH